MTPLIQQMVAMNPEKAVDCHWFDMSAAYKQEQDISGVLLSNPLPYPKTALVCAYDNKRVLLFVIQTADTTFVTGIQLDDDHIKNKTRKQVAIPGFWFLVDDGGIKVKHHDGSPFDYRTSYATGALTFIAAFLESLETTPAVGYLPTKRPNWQKKIRQGKAPAYDWTTITIEPAKPKGADLGGTHASPRWHERRGHWRLIKKTGKRVWVKNCEVGDKALGAVFHDYKIAGQSNDV
jgi:hypothetical protein